MKLALVERYKHARKSTTVEPLLGKLNSVYVLIPAARIHARIVLAPERVKEPSHSGQPVITIPFAVAARELIEFN